MKILAIRGENLASLEGPFEVLLDAGPLADAGVFAIVGETGAGKTTLLDAMCLALFDDTPRLESARAVDVGALGEATLGAKDARSVLRRRAVSGFAEVEFRGVDGHRHRARWSVRRARNKAGGALQAREWWLECVDTGVRCKERKTRELAAAIEAQLGLSFAQFRRAVLLAQGEFAAFLRADESARADLLEQMTGTQLYGDVSKAAFARAREKKGALDIAKLGIELVAILDDDARRTAEAAVDETTRRLSTAKETLATLQDAQLWHATEATLADAFGEAEAALARAVEVHAGAQTRRDALERRRAAEPVRGPRAEWMRATATRDAAESARALAQEEVARASAVHDVAATERARAADAHAVFEAQSRALEPTIEAARALDAELLHATEAVALARAEVVRATRARDEARDECTRARDQQSRVEREIAALDASLAGRTSDARLSNEWARWEQALSRHVALSAQRDRVAVDDAVAREASAAAKVALGEVAIGEALDARARAQSSFSSAELESAATDGGTLHAEKERLVATAAALAAVGTQLDRRDEATLRARRHRAAHAAAIARALEHRATDARATEEARGLASALGEAERTLRDLQARLDVQARRPDLRAGEPCPLCGATEHPWASLEALGAELVDAQRARVTTLTATLKRTEATRTKAETDARASTRDAEAREADAVAEEGASAALDAEAGARMRDEALGALITAAHADARAMHEEAAVALDRLSASWKERQQRHERASEAMTRARAALDRATTNAERIHATLVADRRARDEASTAVTVLRAQRASLDEQRAATLDELRPAFEGRDDSAWIDALERESKAFVARCRRAAATYREETERRELARGALSPLAQAVAAREASLGERARVLEVATTAARAREAELAVRAAARAALLDGAPTLAVVEARRRETARLEAARDAANERHQSAIAAQREAIATDVERASTAVRATSEAASALDAMTRACAAAGFTRDEVDALLARDAAEIVEESRALVAIDEGLQRATIVVGERRARLESHHATASPMQAAPSTEATATREAIDVALAHATSARDALESERAAAAERLRTDDRGRADRAEKQGAYAAMHADAAVWLQLSDLIGQADGAKFKRFAQGLSFTVLLDAANARLREMSRRYSLSRPPGSNLELQVIDHDMGDEVRSIASLSGGEGFIVSLALALGLSAIGSARTKIETLFIDEGFGTLDQRSLEIVLGCLDELHASGRQIGVISHVGELAARLGTRVQVTRQGAGRSVVSVVRG